MKNSLLLLVVVIFSTSLLFSCSNSLKTAIKAGRDESAGNFVKTRDGKITTYNTIKVGGLSNMFIADGKKLDVTDIVAFQTENGYSERFFKSSSQYKEGKTPLLYLFGQRIRKGKIEMFLLVEESGLSQASRERTTYNSNGTSNTTRQASANSQWKNAYFLKKGDSVIVKFLPENIMPLINDNSAAVAEYNRLFHKGISQSKALENMNKVLDIYN
jgi:hypothetical protein